MVKAGDIVKVRVKDVDVERKRIALTMKIRHDRNAIRHARSRPRRQTVKCFHVEHEKTGGRVGPGRSSKACSGGWKGMKVPSPVIQEKQTPQTAIVGGSFWP